MPTFAEAPGGDANYPIGMILGLSLAIFPIGKDNGQITCRRTPVGQVKLSARTFPDQGRTVGLASTVLKVVQSAGHHPMSTIFYEQLPIAYVTFEWRRTGDTAARRFRRP